MFIERAVIASGVDPSRLVFEITESAAIADIAAVRVTVERLRALGCEMALDDFGAGFGSFAYLKHLPFDVLKIDGDFVQDLPISLVDRLSVGAVADVARGLGMITVAEYVTDDATIEMLRDDRHRLRPGPSRRPTGARRRALGATEARGRAAAARAAAAAAARNVHPARPGRGSAALARHESPSSRHACATARWDACPPSSATSWPAMQAKRMRLPGTPRAVAIFHPFQYPLARALMARHPGCELWYGRWDRYEHAYDADERLRRRLTELHTLAAERSALTFAASRELARIETDAGRDAVLVPLAADSFPAPVVSDSVVAVSLGHLGRRCDWALLRAVCERMPALTLLLIGAWHDDECSGDEDYAWCRDSPQLVWLGRRSDDEAARLIGCADVGIVPFKVEPFNDAGLPYRILKHARLGRKTITPLLAGVQTWPEAVVRCEDADAWVAALRGFAGARCAPDDGLRAWALEQTASSQNEPLWARMTELGIGIPQH